MGYTVHRNGEVIGEGLSLTDAAVEILTHDGRDYEVRPLDGGGYGLFVSRGSRNSPSGLGGFVRAWGGYKTIYSPAKTDVDAWREIAAQVVKTSWPGMPEAMTDEAWADKAAS